MSKPEMTLRVPGDKSWALVLRLALSGVAILEDLDVGTLDDLRQASDEACDCLLHQGRAVEALTLTVQDGGDTLQVTLKADYSCGDVTAAPEDCQEETEISRAVLEKIGRAHV